ncbi:2,3-diaminopropionate biosynthesis protein SbnB [Paenibacillus sp. GCM10027627]|uniref:2,3-diaminopropionate biosynthesis protein SbnB n=1 Tax=unclassified Paenibacillus TaxID=185978 RepID=UPI00363F5755
MIYLNENDLTRIGYKWGNIIEVLESAARSLCSGQFSQPLKPYLRFNNPRNRIIAMPAYVGGDISTAGIKWIASFPENPSKGMARAHSTVILNDSDTGIPYAIINTALLSVIRTVGVSGLFLKAIESYRSMKEMTVGIVGLGPIGINHLSFLLDQYGDRIKEIMVFDIDPLKIQQAQALATGGVVVSAAESWEEAYRFADLFITCTVASAPYISLEPKPGSIHLNVSLRDYGSEVYPWFKNGIVVDDWDEVCREGTAIERFHQSNGLNKEDVVDLKGMFSGQALEKIGSNETVIFNPMGMAIFDIAVGHYFYHAAEQQSVGVKME